MNSVFSKMNKEEALSEALYETKGTGLKILTPKQLL